MYCLVCLRVILPESGRLIHKLIENVEGSQYVGT